MTILPSNLRPSHMTLRKRGAWTREAPAGQGIKGGLKNAALKMVIQLNIQHIQSSLHNSPEYHECWGYFRVGFSSETLPSTAICSRETSRVKKCAWSQWAAAAVQVQNFRTVFFFTRKKREKKTAESHPTKYWLRVIIQIDKKKTTSSYNGG